MCKLPPDEKLKRELVSNFGAHKSYHGREVRETITNTNFTVLRKDVTQKPSKVKKGDVFTNFEGIKKRPCVVCKVLKDNTVLYIPLTSTENVHCLNSYNDRFWGEGCFSKAFNVTSEEFVLDNFVGVFDSKKDLNKAIKQLKEYINKNL